jgi:hypothetical protein
MKKILHIFSAVLVFLFSCQTRLLASSHREAPLISNDPLADNTDLYAFKSPCDTNNIVFIANYIPFEHPAGGPNWYTFGENIRYEIHIDNNPATQGDDIIYRFTFTHANEDPTTFFNIRLGKQNIKTTYKLEKSTNGGSTFTTIVANGIVPPPNIGPRSIENAVVGLGADSYKALMTAAIATATTGEKVFAGPVDDPFFVDLGGAFDVGGFRKKGRDGVAKFNCHSIVIEVPVSSLQKNGKTTKQASNILDGDFVIGVYATASRKEITTLEAGGANETTDGKWIQVSRLGMPLTNEAVIPIGSKDKWNATLPANDLQFAAFFQNPELALYMDDSQFGGAVPGLSQLRIQTNSLGAFDFRNGKPGLYPLKGSPAVAGTALDDAIFGNILLPNNHSPRAVDLLPIFYTGVPNLRPYQLATGKPAGNPLAEGKPFINNFLPTLGDYLRLNMAVPVTARNDPKFSTLGIVGAAVLGLTDAAYNGNKNLQFIPNMDGFPNGRRLEDDVTTIELQAVSGVALAAIGLWYDDYTVGQSPVTKKLLNVLTFNAGITHNDTTFQPCFPYVQEPWRGFTGEGYVGPHSNDPLPVNWLSFTASKQGNKVQLRWKVSEAVNNKYFDVERSNDGQTFSKIGSVDAISGDAGAYILNDPAPSIDATNYYRIKQVDKDGKYSYSVIRSVFFGVTGKYSVSPNPAKDFINVFSSEDNTKVYIVNSAGTRLSTAVVPKGTARIDLSSLPAGAYTIVFENEGVISSVQKVVKQ